MPDLKYLYHVLQINIDQLLNEVDALQLKADFKKPSRIQYPQV
jgi:hypothetical protein